MTSELWRLSACEIVAGVKSGAFSASEAVRAALDRMEAVNGRINAVVDSDPRRRWRRRPASTRASPPARTPARWPACR